MKLQAISITVLALALSSCAPSAQDSASQNQALAKNIIGGKNASLDYQKENGIVGLQIIEFNEKGKATSVAGCTGSLLSKRVVLTAAHCVYGKAKKAVRVVFGTNSTKPPAESVINAQSYKIHSGFAPSEPKDFKTDAPWVDMAILVLKSDAPEDFKFATLPTEDDVVTADDGLTLAGFGITNPIVNKKEDWWIIGEVIIPQEGIGAGTLRSVNNIKVLDVKSDNSEILMDLEGGKRGACHGDSGGPAFLKKNGKNILVGVTSRGTNMLGNCNEKVIYTGTLGYLSWIKAAL